MPQLWVWKMKKKEAKLQSGSGQFWSYGYKYRPYFLQKKKKKHTNFYLSFTPPAIPMCNDPEFKFDGLHSHTHKHTNFFSYQSSRGPFFYELGVLFSHSLNSVRFHNLWRRVRRVSCVSLFFFFFYLCVLCCVCDSKFFWNFFCPRIVLLSSACCRCRCEKNVTDRENSAKNPWRINKCRVCARVREDSRTQPNLTSRYINKQNKICDFFYYKYKSS